MWARTGVVQPLKPGHILRKGHDLLGHLFSLLFFSYSFQLYILSNIAKVIVLISQSNGGSIFESFDSVVFCKFFFSS